MPNCPPAVASNNKLGETAMLLIRNFDRRDMGLGLLLAGAVITLSGCQQGESPAAAAEIAPTTSESMAIVSTAEENWNTMDKAKIMSPYLEGAVMIDAMAPAPSVDRAVQEKWAAGFAKMKLDSHQVPDRRIQVLDARTMVASGTATFQSSKAATAKPVAVRFTDVYQKQDDGSWKIVHEHLSLIPAAEGTAG
jgi:ketosteroid isomerase-like protein